ncbi:MAG: hypothetical protein DRO04_02190 [Candidatus Iainarchaeum archaeon]|uniref:Gins51 C-terminal domain-containing protein n=1 Tax=Candidatus Iainarchaeum sp. TaxID=3101447 RepID=A0A497JGS3_9ARCH|nr:MAG: hypothetical protein DRO04_02190 [Candidatus Diapherotrites archaeon]
MPLTYDELRRIYRLEKSTTKLVQVSDDFYNALYEFLQNEKKRYLESLRSLGDADIKTFTNLKRMVQELLSLREKKILNMALIASRLDSYNIPNIPPVEKEMFQNILQILEKHNKILDDIFAPTLKKEKKEELKTIKIQLCADIPKFLGQDMQEYGPFKNNDVVTLPYKVANLLIEKNLAKVVG